MGQKQTGVQLRLDGTEQPLYLWFDDGLTVKERMQDRMDKVLALVQKFDEYAAFYPVAECGKPAFVANWNKAPDQPRKWIEEVLECETYFEDEICDCGSCGKLLSTIPGYYGDVPQYIEDAFGVTCRECWEASPYFESHSFIGPYLPGELRAFPAWAMPTLEAHGFHCLEDEMDSDACVRFENGLHPGMNDTPKTAIRYVKEMFGEVADNLEFCFVLTDVGQFYCGFTILCRKKEA